MSITDELRFNIEGAEQLYGCECKHLLAIADRIDAEHEKAMSRAGQLLADAEKDRDYNYANWQECKQKVLQHNITMDELSTEIERLEDELAHRIELPKDADNVPWNPGDGDEDGNVVIELRLTSDGWFVITDGEWPYRPESKRHYHAQTVEDVLREFANEVYADADNEIRDRDFLCAKYAKRLTLAEESSSLGTFEED